MKLEEALRLSTPNQCLGRDAWTNDGAIMKLVSSEKTLDKIKLSLNLTPESLNADDWNIYDIRESETLNE